MKRLTAAALAVGILTASCSGHGGSSALPAAPSGGGTPSTIGAHSTRTASTAVSIPLGWASTGTQAVPFTGATDNGALPANQTLTIRLALQLRNVDQFKSAVAAGQIVPRGTFMSTYAPTSDQVAQTRRHVGPCAHVPGFLLQPDHFAQVAVAANDGA